MNAKRYCKVKDQAVMRVKDINSQVTIYHLTSSEATEKFMELMNNLPKGTPQGLRQYLHGYWDCLRASYHDHFLEFCYILADGRIVSTWKESVRHYAKLGMSPKELYDLSGRKSGFFWIGTDKAYFLGED